MGFGDVGEINPAAFPLPHPSLFELEKLLRAGGS